ncbi:MAG: Dabb family protein [Chitinophagaceae bacterium]
MLNSTDRKFLDPATIAAISPEAFKQTEFPATPTVIHHVFFWLKNAGSEADRKELTEGLHRLAAINEVQQLLVGTPAATEVRGVVDGSFDVSELMYFESLADQATYQEHATHKAFVEKYSHLWARVVVYDMVVG